MYHQLKIIKYLPSNSTLLITILFPSDIGGYLNSEQTHHCFRVPHWRVLLISEVSWRPSLSMVPVALSCCLIVSKYFLFDRALLR